MEVLSGIADYEFIRVIGEGAHGSFYLARPPERIGAERELVAVKVLSLGSSTDAFRRMTRELRVFASVPSPYLVHLYDAGRYLDTFYYAMEYYELGSLAAPSRPRERDEILRAVADASRAAHDLHEAGVAHRGIKPANVLVHEEGAKLSDLGLAQILAPGQTVTGLQGLGSIEYVDQEVLRGEPTSRSSDIWALGATLHRALTGNGLYGELPTGQTIAALRQVLDREPVIDPSLPRDVAEIIAACINADPGSRPATAEDLALRIDALIGV
ncbi:MAG: serine/threonine-protein kinase [Acidimicrobiia bacterium]